MYLLTDSFFRGSYVMTSIPMTVHNKFKLEDDVIDYSIKFNENEKFIVIFVSIFENLRSDIFSHRIECKTKEYDANNGIIKEYSIVANCIRNSGCAEEIISNIEGAYAAYCDDKDLEYRFNIINSLSMYIKDLKNKDNIFDDIKYLMYVDFEDSHYVDKYKCEPIKINNDDFAVDRVYFNGHVQFNEIFGIENYSAPIAISNVKLYPGYNDDLKSSYVDIGLCGLIDNDVMILYVSYHGIPKTPLRYVCLYNIVKFHNGIKVQDTSSYTSLSYTEIEIIEDLWKKSLSDNISINEINELISYYL